MNSTTSKRHSLKAAYKDEFFKDYCSCIWTDCDNYPEEEVLFRFVKVLKVSSPKHNGHDDFIKQVFEVLFEEGRIKDFTEDFFLRVVFFSSPVNDIINIQLVNVGSRSEPRLQYSKDSIEYFSRYEIDSINSIKEIIRDVLDANDLIDEMVEDEYEIVVGNQELAKKISIKPIPNEEDPDFRERL